MRTSPRRVHDGVVDAAIAIVALTSAAIGAWVWLWGEMAGWLSGHGWPRVPVAAIPVTVARLPSHLGDPRRAWPAAARAALPGLPVMVGCAAVLFVASAICGWAAWRVLSSPPAPHRGARWAGRTDLRPLRVRGRRRRHDRLALGHQSGRLRRTMLHTESRHSVLAIGPTQSGKTSALAVPAILDWRGPVIATSVKDDLGATTLAWRSRVGPCWVFDPTQSTGLGRTAGWTPLSACPDWSSAQRMAAWLVDATPARTGMVDAAFWYAAAAKQLAPLLLAASTGGLSMADVVRWTNAGAFDEPAAFLQLAGEADAALALAACEARDSRIQSSVATTLETVLAPFEDPVVARATECSDIDLDAWLDRRGSLYLCGPSHEQHRIQGLFAALVSSAVAAAIRRAGDTARPLDPPLLVVLDEVANIAPIRDLDTLASTAAGFGVQLVTVCQDLAQLGHRYGTERARTIANNHRAKILLSGVSDLTTLDLVSGLAGEEAVREETITHDQGRRTRATAVAFRRLAPTDALRRIPPGSGVLVYGHLPPVRLRLRPWYADRHLRRRASA